jgi:uncharacterized membrane protein
LALEQNPAVGETAMAFCSSCGTQVADGTTLCAACSSRAPAANAQAGGGLADNVAGMLAYVTFVPAIIFLVMEPYNRSRFIRFHAFQSIFLWVAWFVTWIVMAILSMVVGTILPILGHLLGFLITLVVGLGFFLLWIVLLLKANQKQMYKLPVIGDMAEKQANSTV